MMGKLLPIIIFAFSLSFGFLAANQNSVELKDFSSMGSTIPDSHFERFKGKITLIPEYAPAFGVLFGGQIFQMEEKGIIEELRAIYMRIAQSQPQLKIYMIASDQPHEKYGNQTALGFWKRRLPSSFTFIPVPQEDLHSHPAFDGRPENVSPWVRDYGPITAQFAGRRTWLEFMPGTLDKIDPMMDRAPIPLARTLDIPVLSPEIYLHGGNFMVNSKGTCVFSEEINTYNYPDKDETDPAANEKAVVKRLKKVMGCRDVIILPYLPYEGTGHIDLFAKFVNDTTVFLNKYENERVHKATIRKTLYCGKSPRFPPPLSMCRETESTIEFARDPDGKLATFDPSSIGIEIDQVDHPGSLLEHHKKVKKIFESKGFKVIDIPTPQPVATLEIRTIHSEDEKQSVTEKPELSMNHLSFMNTLLLNKFAYVPEYKILENTDYNRLAREKFEKYGFQTYGLPSDEIILKLGGGVHCATMQLN